MPGDTWFSMDKKGKKKLVTKAVNCSGVKGIE